MQNFIFPVQQWDTTKRDSTTITKYNFKCSKWYHFIKASLTCVCLFARTVVAVTLAVWRPAPSWSLDAPFDNVYRPIYYHSLWACTCASLIYIYMCVRCFFVCAQRWCRSGENVEVRLCVDISTGITLVLMKGRPFNNIKFLQKY
jgi:hypothetical protein